ncbi:MAG: AEC family transporter [Nannocystaceae bacterium]|nr:AEC family transporter [bacterium]
MSSALDNALRLLELAVPALVGAGCGALGLFADPKAAVSVLNRYALYVGFPALVARGLLLPSASIPTEPAFWLLWPVALAITVALSRGVSRPAVGLGAVFGNVAYLGLPYVAAVMGESSAGPAALAVAVHVTGAVTVGPVLLARGSGQPPPWTSVATRVLRMPLLWAPIAGLALRNAPPGARSLAGQGLAPFASSAAVVALFLLGLHVYAERARVARVGRSVLGLVAVRMLLAPAVVLGLGLACRAAGLLSVEFVRLHVLLAAMPLAITTFSMAHDADVEADRVAGAVVLSSLLAAVMLPLWGALL